MNKFLNLDEDKKQRIINACLKEFSINGYDKASTNGMVKEAGISKGLLFHYFTNKKKLYLFLYQYVMEIYKNEFNDYMKTVDHDLMIRLKEGIRKKIEISNKYPLLFKFMETALLEESHEVKNEIKMTNETLVKYGISFFKDIDRTKFRDDIAVDKILHIMIWTFRGYEDDLLRKMKGKGSIKDYQALLEELDEYIQIFKKTFYKMEELR